MKQKNLLEMIFNFDEKRKNIRIPFLEEYLK